MPRNTTVIPVPDPRHEPTPGDVLGYFDGTTPIVVRVNSTSHKIDGTHLVSYTMERRDWRACDRAEVVDLPVEMWRNVAADWDVIVVAERCLAPLPDWIGSTLRSAELPA